MSLFNKLSENLAEDSSEREADAKKTTRRKLLGKGLAIFAGAGALALPLSAKRAEAAVLITCCWPCSTAPTPKCLWQCSVRDPTRDQCRNPEVGAQCWPTTTRC